MQWKSYTCHITAFVVTYIWDEVPMIQTFHQAPKLQSTLVIQLKDGLPSLEMSSMSVLSLIREAKSGGLDSVISHSPTGGFR